VVSNGPLLKSGHKAVGVEIGEVVETEQRAGWTRLRSVLLLAALLAGLGVAAAALVGLLALATAAVLDQALG
jgi:hypothetical protein